jgi:predicted nucleotidyltransferase
MGISRKYITLEEALFSKTLREILALLFTHPDQNFYTNEIIRLVSSGSGAAQRELKKLAEVELIVIHKSGNQKRYQANQNSPIFSELRGIMIKTFGLADLIRNVLTPIVQQIHISFIYGSIAKQEAHAKSDIDLMILSDKLSYADVFPLLENVSIKLQRAINPTIYTPGELAQKLKNGNDFLSRVLKQPKIFLIGNEDELRSLLRDA